MKYLLDSNVVIELLRGNSLPQIRLRHLSPSDFGIPALVAHELYYGAFKSQRASDHLTVVDGLQLEVLEFNREDARQAGALRAALAAAGSSMGPYDVLTAGQALARQLTLVTYNAREFRHVPDLKIEDWQV